VAAPAAPLAQVSGPIGDMTAANPMLAMMMGSMAAFATMFQQGGIGQHMFGGLPQPQGTFGANTVDASRSEAADIVYPEILEYFEKLMADNPRCHDALEGLAQLLVSDDYFCIDEIASEEVEWFMAEPYKLTSGTAKFVVRMVREAMEQAQREAKGA
jgi:hypothetical protein